MKPDAAARKLHFSSLVIDMHSDVHLDVIRSRGRGETRVLERRHLPKWRAGGVDGVVLNTIPRFGPTPYPYYTSPARNALLMLDAIHQEIAESAEHFALVLSPDGFHEARAAGKIGLMLGLEGAEAVEDDLGLLRAYHRMGLRILTLTWHQRNFAADGVAEPSGAGLSNFGRALVLEMNRLGILVDVSHLSPAGVDDVLAVSEAPIVASHSNTRALCDHQRNLTDRQICAIASAGGVIGVVFLGRFVASEHPTSEQVLNHIDHLKRLAGSGHVGLGPDYCEGGEDLIIAARRIAGPGQPVDDATIPFARGLEDASRLPDLTRGLLDRGYAETEIAGILGQNFIAVFERATRHAPGVRDLTGCG